MHERAHLARMHSLLYLKRMAAAAAAATVFATQSRCVCIKWSDLQSSSGVAAAAAVDVVWARAHIVIEMDNNNK